MENKERLLPEGKREPLVKPATPEVKIPAEIASWIARVEKKDLYLTSPVTDDSGQILVTSPQAKKPQITLPLTKIGLVAGLKKGLEEATRWLAEWCFRLIKMYPGRVWFKSSKEGEIV